MRTYDAPRGLAYRNVGSEQKNEYMTRDEFSGWIAKSTADIFEATSATEVHIGKEAYRNIGSDQYFTLDGLLAARREKGDEIWNSAAVRESEVVLGERDSRSRSRTPQPTATLKTDVKVKLCSDAAAENRNAKAKSKATPSPKASPKAKAKSKAKPKAKAKAKSKAKPKAKAVVSLSDSGDSEESRDAGNSGASEPSFATFR